MITFLLFLAVAHHSVTLTWIASTTPGSVTYNVYRSALPGACSKTAKPLATGIKTTVYVDTTVQANSKYFYNVASVDANGETCSQIEQECSTSSKRCRMSATPFQHVLAPPHPHP